MNKFIIWILLSLPLFVRAQHFQTCIGFTEAQIKKGHPDVVYLPFTPELKQILRKGQNGMYVSIALNTDTTVYCFIFDSTNTCIRQLVTTPMSFIINSLVRKLNSDAVKVSDTEWTYYAPGNSKPIDIELSADGYYTTIVSSYKQ